jgi:transcriptional regulator with XRE-family HTH domain
MTDFPLLAAQIRAARALLGWSQDYLARGVKMSRATLADLESNKRQPHEATIFMVMAELTAAGINFTETGVEFREFPPRPYVPTGIKSRRT